MLAGMSLEIIKVNSFIREYHEYLTEWEPRSGDVYGLTREPGNIKDSNAVAVVRETSGNAEIGQTHPNNLTDKFEVIGHVPRLMATWLNKFQWKGHDQGEARKQRWRLWSRGSLRVPI